MQGISFGSQNTFYVVGSLISIHDGVNTIDGSSYTCGNQYHEQQSNGFCKIAPHAAAPSIDIVDPLIGAHAFTCVANDATARPNVFVCTNFRLPKTSTSGSSDVKKLPIFCIALGQWIDDNLQTVIVPNELKINNVVGGKHCQSTSSIWRCTSFDSMYFWQCRDIHIADVQDWSEYAFNVKMGPFLNLSSACAMRDNFNEMFRDLTARSVPRQEIMSEDSTMYVQFLLTFIFFSLIFY